MKGTYHFHLVGCFQIDSKSFLTFQILGKRHQKWGYFSFSTSGAGAAQSLISVSVGLQCFWVLVKFQQCYLYKVKYPAAVLLC